MSSLSSRTLKISGVIRIGEWIVIILLSISISKTFQKVGDGYHLRFGQGPLSRGVRVESEDPAILLDFNR